MKRHRYLGQDTKVSGHHEDKLHGSITAPSSTGRTCHSLRLCHVSIFDFGEIVDKAREAKSL